MQKLLPLERVSRPQTAEGENGKQLEGEEERVGEHQEVEVASVELSMRSPKIDGLAMVDRVKIVVDQSNDPIIGKL
jgi:hypothetical protein